MNKQSREELKRLAEEATPGPWRTEKWTTGIRGTEIMDKHHVRISCDMLEHNAKFAASANPAAIQSLLSELDRLEAQRDRLLNACKSSMTVMDLLRTTGDDAKSWCAQDRSGAMVKVSDLIKSCQKAITEAESEQ